MAKRDQPKPTRTKTGGWILGITLAVWLIVFFLIRKAVGLGGNPLIVFLIMMVLLFLVAFVVRVGAIKSKVYYGRARRSFDKFRLSLIRFFGKQ